jgi:hypothetical protein
MKVIQLMNTQREVVGQIHWMPPAQIHVDVSDISLVDDLNNLIADAREKGLPLRGGGSSEHDAKRVFVETVEQIKAEDERFSQALAEMINRNGVAGQRFFCLIKEVEVDHTDV